LLVVLVVVTKTAAVAAQVVIAHLLALQAAVQALKVN